MITSRDLVLYARCLNEQIQEAAPDLSLEQLLLLRGKLELVLNAIKSRYSELHGRDINETVH